MGADIFSSAEVEFLEEYNIYNTAPDLYFSHDKKQGYFKFLKKTPTFLIAQYLFPPGNSNNLSCMGP